MLDCGPLLLNFRGLNGTGQKRLKIGLAADSDHDPPWIRSLIELLACVPAFELHIFPAGRGSHLKPTTSSWLAERLYSWSRQAADPFGDMNPDSGEAGPDGPDTLRGAILAGNLDLLCWIADRTIPEGPCADLARFGVITVRLGEASTRPPYWREVIDQEVVSRATILWHAASFERARVVRMAEIGTKQGWFFTRNAEECLAAVCRMIAAVGIELLSDATSWIQRQLSIPEEDCRIPGQRKYPSNLASAGFIAHQTWRSIGLRAKGRGRLPGWFVALRRDPARHYARSGEFSPVALEEIPLPPGFEMADPFLVADGSGTWLFFEEVPAGATKGRLSCMEVGVDRVGFSAPAVVLERDYHLSYPCVVSERGEFFLVPESCETRNIQLFRAARFPFEWEMETILFEDLPAVDTTPFFLDGRWYFFTTTIEPFMETLLFWSDSLGGRWHLHPKSPISSSARSSRSAGNLFYRDGRLLRPTQDCSVRYGYG